MSHPGRFLLALALLACSPAWASGTCAVTSATVGAQTYTGAAIAATGTVNWTCTRTSNGADGSPTTFIVNAGPGSAPGATRNAAATGLTVPYGLKIGGATGTDWGDGVSGLGNGTTVTVSFAGPSTTASGSFNFTMTVAAGLLPLVGRTYTDLVTIDGTCTTKKNSGCTVTGTTLPISIAVNTSCTVIPPTNFNLAYTAFQTATATASTTFRVNCSNGAAYRMSVSPASATAAGIAYTLKLGTAANSATDVSSTTGYNLAGNGTDITYYVNASAAANQAGTCATPSCSASTLHTLTVDY